MKLSQELIAILAVGVTLIGMVGALFVSMGRMETRLRGEMHDQIGAVRGEIGVLRDEMRSEMSVLRSEMSILREDVRHDIDALRIDIQDIRGDVRQLRDKLLVPAGA